MSSRALRRHRRARTRQAAARKLRASGYARESIDRLAPRLADNLRACSCTACARPSWPTQAELAAQLSEREQTVDPIGDIYSDGWCDGEILYAVIAEGMPVADALAHVYSG